MTLPAFQILFNQIQVKQQHVEDELRAVHPNWIQPELISDFAPSQEGELGLVCRMMIGYLYPTDLGRVTYKVSFYVTLGYCDIQGAIWNWQANEPDVESVSTVLQDKIWFSDDESDSVESDMKAIKSLFNLIHGQVVQEIYEAFGEPQRSQPYSPLNA